MNIWIDLANSPQVLFFRPIINELQNSGHEVWITTRDFAQTIALADLYGFKHTSIGHHGGRRIGGALRENLKRAYALWEWGHQCKIDVAVSHNSYSQALAALFLRVPFITLMDYEHQPLNHLCFRLARSVIVPQAFPDNLLRKYGADGKIHRYLGAKEEVYLSDFEPIGNFLKDSDLPSDKVLVVIRPPGDWALYHRFANSLFHEVFDYVVSHTHAVVVFLPRIAGQAEEMRSRKLSNVVIPHRALNGPNLIYHADVVISGGGTMNREAAVLGTPAYTVFAGYLGAVDKYLIELGRMKHIAVPNQIGDIEIKKSYRKFPILRNPGLVKYITDLILH
ncbi:DUF354 domain-containing protein [Candidatus Poribacteria bacterium]|nr:DUF354 domain-containing protein [Candidatus Poribacteria bacterium]